MGIHVRLGCGKRCRRFVFHHTTTVRHPYKSPLSPSSAETFFPIQVGKTELQALVVAHMRAAKLSAAGRYTQEDRMSQVGFFSWRVRGYQYHAAGLSAMSSRGYVRAHAQTHARPCVDGWMKGSSKRGWGGPEFPPVRCAYSSCFRPIFRFARRGLVESTRARLLPGSGRSEFFSGRERAVGNAFFVVINAEVYCIIHVHSRWLI